MMETASTADLTPVLEALEGISWQLDSVLGSMDMLLFAQLTMTGALMGAMVILVLAVMWR